MKSRRSRRVAVAITCATVFALGGAASFVALRYLTEYGRSVPIAGGIALATTIALIVLLKVLPRLESPKPSFALAGISLSIGLLILGSILIGRVTHSRFGFTVYGAIPIPALDITIDGNGVLWFRDKTHRITMEEIEPLVSGSTQLILIGTGWHERARVDPKILERWGDQVEALETGAAFDAFRRARTEGKRVVLLAHTTC